jgi:ketosteroid isomerase-like protein
MNPLTESAADAFAASWLAAWNAHDVAAITAHYRDDVVYRSPFVARMADGASELRGIDGVRRYIGVAVERYPTLFFAPPAITAVGADSVALVYRSVDDLTAVETLRLDADGRVAEALCHYRRAGIERP